MMSEKTQCHCNRCGHPTNHTVIATDQTIAALGETGSELHWYNQCEMLKCLGCDEVSLRLTCGFVGDPNSTSVNLYPPRIARRAPHWAWGGLLPSEVPEHICGLMRETYTAVQNGSCRLAAMGVRAAIESVMIEKIGDQQTFQRALKAFEEMGYISARQRRSLESILEAGHAAIHRNWEPSKSDVSTLLDIAESVIETVYVHELRAQELGMRVPPRKPRNG